MFIQSSNDSSTYNSFCTQQLTKTGRVIHFTEHNI